MIYSLDQITQQCESLDFSETITEGFIAYSDGKVVVPPVGELSFEAPPGDTHIKYGYIKGDDCFVIKIASGFYDNPKLGLPSNSGLMLIFSQKSGILQSILLDEGYLTDVRTAVAGQIAADLLAPEDVYGIGVFGTGIQARMQVEYLRKSTTCRKLFAWGRTAANLDAYCIDMEKLGFEVFAATEPALVTENCNLLVTTTPSRQPLITAEMVRPGTHITAMGSDTSYKQELDPAILAKADLVVADSIAQCLERGEIHQALKQGQIEKETVSELGSLLKEGKKARESEDQITLADLTGVAVQDIMIAKSVAKELTRE